MTIPELKSLADIRSAATTFNTPVMQDISDIDRQNLALSRITARTLLAVLNHYGFELVHANSHERLMYHECAFFVEELNEMMAAARAWK